MATAVSPSVRDYRAPETDSGPRVLTLTTRSDAVDVIDLAGSNQDALRKALVERAKALGPGIFGAY